MPVGSISATSSTTLIATDPRDLNGDGKVTEAELQAYALKHPDHSRKDTSASKTQESALDVAGSGVNHLLDIYS